MKDLQETESSEEEKENKENAPVAKVTTSYQRTCNECGKNYLAKLGTSKFCSDACKLKNYRKRKSATGMNGPEDDIDSKPKNNVSGNVVSVIQGLSPQAQYIIGDQQKQNNRLQKLYDDEREARKKLKGKYEDLKEEHIRMQNDHRIETIENKKPSGLAGLAESPLFPELMQHIGPALGMLAQGLVQKLSGIGNGGLAGVEGQLDADVQNQIVEINKWYAVLPKQMQASVYDILVKFATQSPEQLPETLNRISNLLKNGTTAAGSPKQFHQGINQASGTFQ